MNFLGLQMSYCLDFIASYDNITYDSTRDKYAVYQKFGLVT